MIEQIRDIFAGGIYTHSYEVLSDGGPKCYADMDPTFRISIAIFSVIINVFILKFLYSKVSKG